MFRSCSISWAAPRRGWHRRWSEPECRDTRYVHAVVGIEPGIGKVKIGLSRATINAPHWWWPISVSLPVPIRLFVLAFDRGQFPELLLSPDGLGSAPPALQHAAAPRPSSPPDQGEHPTGSR